MARRQRKKRKVELNAGQVCGRGCSTMCVDVCCNQVWVYVVEKGFGWGGGA